MVAEVASGEPKPLTAAQVARELGVHVETVRRWVARGVLAGTKSPFTRRVTVPPDVLDAFVKQRTGASAAAQE
jgi:excisionase family DNA binding protein